MHSRIIDSSAQSQCQNNCYDKATTDAVAAATSLNARSRTHARAHALARTSRAQHRDVDVNMLPRPHTHKNAHAQPARVNQNKQTNAQQHSHTHEHTHTHKVESTKRTTLDPTVPSLVQKLNAAASSATAALELKIETERRASIETVSRCS